MKDREWNLFARELRDILAERGARLRQLAVQAQIHPWKISRLQHSLHTPKFHVLTPDEIEQIVVIYCINEDEQQRLRAAILATAVADMLMGRILDDDALKASEEIFIIILNALRGGALNMTKGDLVVTDAEIPDEESNAALEGILRIIDRGFLALYLSSDTDNLEERRVRAHESYTSFSTALDLLDNLDSVMKQLPEWQEWRTEVEQGLLQAQVQLRVQ